MQRFAGGAVLPPVPPEHATQSPSPPAQECSSFGSPSHFALVSDAGTSTKCTPGGYWFHADGALPLLGEGL
jgi:hypothetical protein